MAPPVLDAARTSTNMEEKPLLYPENQSIRILIVEDDPVYRRSLYKALTGAGYRVFTAANGLEAMEFLTQLKFSLILFDVKRPYQGGLDDLKTILRFAGESKIVVMTTFNENSLKNKVLQMGARDFLVKPIRKAALLNSIAKTLRG